MKRLIFGVLLLLASNAFAQSKSPITGEWEGDSVCQVPKPCTTEHVIYEIRPGNAGKVVIKADKVVDGQREWMGDIPCDWVAAEQRLSCPMEGRKPVVWTFRLTGDQLTGTAILREGDVLIRKIAVHRKK
jgi:hypothetical protein